VDPTAKEAAKDPVFDPTLKEVRKDPIGDQTIKELAKDPIRDPGTIKEVGRDPIGPGGGTLVEVNPLPGQLGQPQIGPFGGGVNPFVIAGASRAQDPSQALNDAVATAQQLAAALGELEQQYGQLAEAYAAAVANVEALSQGQG
jgi:hypothetical protein